MTKCIVRCANKLYEFPRQQLARTITPGKPSSLAAAMLRTMRIGFGRGRCIFSVFWNRMQSKSRYRKKAMAYYVELRTPAGGETISWDIARHLYARQIASPAVILVDSPATFLPAMRKQWVKLTRSVQFERARTLDASLILAFTRITANMRHMQFTVHTSALEPSADVFILKPNALADMPPSCRTLYLVGVPPDPERLLTLCDRLPRRSLVVAYGEAAAAAFR